MLAERQVAAVFYLSPAFLLGLAEATRGSMQIDAMKKHMPDAVAQLEAGMSLEKVAAKYPVAIAKVRRTFANKALAAQADTRVDV